MGFFPGGEMQAQTVNICNRSGDVEAAILAAINEVEEPDVDCDDVTAAQLAAVNPGAGLDISDGLIQTLRVGDFAGLVSLTTLTLSRNGGEFDMPTGVFTGLVALKTLTLSDNSRLGERALRAGLFTGLTALETLTLSGSEQLGNTQALPARLFTGLTALETLTLSDNAQLGAQQALPVGLFTGLTALETLTLSGNVRLGNTQALPAELFTGLAALKTLTLSGNTRLGNTQALPAELFTGLTALETLTVSNNQTLGRVALPAGLFTDLTALKTLTLSGNNQLGLRGARLPVGLFTSLTALKTLTLSNNPTLDILPSSMGFFTGLTALTTLDLSHNPSLGTGDIINEILVSLPDDLFAPLTALKTLDLSNNQNLGAGAQFAGLFANLTALETLDLSDNGVLAARGTLVADFFIGLTALKTLDLSNIDGRGHAVSLSDGFFNGLTALKTLDLSSNSTLNPEDIHPGVFDDILDTLTELSLDARLRGTASFAAEIFSVGQGARAPVNVELRNGANEPHFLPVSLYIPITVAGADGVSVMINGVVIRAGAVSALTTVTALAGAPATISGALSLGTPVLLLTPESGRPVTPITRAGTDEQKDRILGAFVEVDDNKDESVLAVIDVCSRTDEVKTAILAAVGAAEGSDIACGDVTPRQLAGVDPGGGLVVSGADFRTLQVRDFVGLTGLTALDLSGNLNLGLQPLPAGLFTDLAALTRLDLSGLGNLDPGDLPAGIFDDVLDTLTELSLDARFRGTASFAAGTVSVEQGGETTVSVELRNDANEPHFLPVAVYIPIAVAGADGVSVAAGGAVIPAGATNVHAAVTTLADAALTSSGTLSLGTPVLLLTPESGEPTTPIARAGTDEQKARVLDAIVAVDGDNDERTLVVIGICSRTIEAVLLAVINAAQGPGIACGDVTAAQLAGINPDGGLVISGGNFQTLRVVDFANLASLTMLTLSGNLILGNTQFLPAGLFAGLTALETLDLSNNLSLGSEALPAGLFTGLAALETLDLSNNLSLGGEALPAGLFTGLAALETLDLSNNSSLGSEVLPAGLFTGLAALETLDLSNNSSLGSEVLPAGLFTGLAALTTLDLSNNPSLGNEVLPAGLFTGLTALETLDLSNNPNLGSEALPVNLFASLAALTALDLSSNLSLNTQDLPAGMFTGLTALETLDLSDNPSLGDEVLPAGLFDGLVALTTLDLSDTPGLNTEDLPVSVFDDVLDTLTGLSLDARLKGTVSFAAGSLSAGQGGGGTIAVELKNGNAPHFLPVTVRIPINVAGADGVGVAGGGVVIPAGTVSVSAIITVSANATATTSGVLSLGTPVLLLTLESGDPGAVIARTGTDEQRARVLDAIVALDGIEDESSLTVEERTAQTVVGICDRTDEVEAVILGVINEAEGPGIACDAVTAGQLANVNPDGGLVISGAGFSTLQVGDFTDLTGLMALDLSNNPSLGGEALPAGLFIGLTGLATLDLSNNPSLGGEALLAGLFIGLTGLATLDLSNNPSLGSEALPADLFIGLTGLAALDLSNNSSLGSFALSADLFAPLTALETLDLSDNDLGNPALPIGLFADLAALTTLDLSNNPGLSVQTLPAGIFDNVLDTLTGLFLDAELKSIASFAAESFSVTQDDRTTITVVLDRPAAVAMHIPVTAAGVVGISVAGGGVVIPAGMTNAPTIVTARADALLVSGMLSLNTPVLLLTPESGEPTTPIARAGTDEQKAAVLGEIVALDANNDERGLTVAAINICDRTDEVEAAILKAIRDIEGPSIVCEAVTAGQLAAVNPDGGLVISERRFSFGSFQTLKIGDFAGLSSLTTLTVSNNPRLGEQALPADLFRGLTALKMLRMTDNPVLGESIDFVGLPINLFRGLTALKTLDLSHNRGLGRHRLLLSGTFAGLTALEALDLSDNPFLRLEIELFLELTALKTLDLSNNPYLGRFGELSPEVGFLPERIFAGLGELTTLDLSNNAGLGLVYPLSPLLFNGLASLKTLDLSGNESANMIRPLDGLDSADLPPAIFDGILDTLTELSLDPGLRGVVSFAAGSVRAGGEGSETSANVVLNQPVAVAMYVPIIVSGVDGVSVTGGGATIPAGVTDARAIVTAPANIIPTTAGMLSLGTPVLLLTPESGEPTTPVTLAGTDEQKARVLGTIVAVDGDNDERALIVIDICGRTDEVEDAILAAINAVEGPGVACGDVTVAQLAGVDPDGGLVISGGSFQTLQIGDFAGLSALTTLDLSGNENLGPEGLPAGIFDDVLDTLTGLSLDVRLKATASFAAGSVSVGQGEEAMINVEFRNDRDEFQFLPVAVHVPITVAGADGVSVAGGGVTIPAGTTNASTVITASPTAALTVSGVLSLSTPVVVLLTPASGEPTTPITLAGTDEQKARVLGAIIALDDDNDDLVLSVTGICNRTDEVVAAVLAAVNAVEEPDIACAGVTVTQLAAVDPAGGLVISGGSFQALQVGDFAGLTALTMLDLSDNRDLGLQAQPVDLLNLREALPAGLFADLTALADLDLSGNQNLDPEDLPSGVFDSVLDTLTGLSLDARLKGTVSFAAGSVSVGQGAVTTVAVELTNGGMPHFLPATLYIPINITGADGVSVAGGGVLIPAATGDAGAAAQFPDSVPAARGSVTAIITALADAAATTAGMLSLGTPVLLLTPDIEESGVLFQGRGEILQIGGVAETPIARTGTDEQKARVLDAIVALDDANDERVLTVEERSSQTVVGICDRTEEVEVAILAAINAVEEPDVACDAVTAGQLAGVNPAGGLVISGGSFEILQVGDFTDLVALETLAIVNNPDLGSQILPAGLFAGLTALTTLDLSHNPTLGGPDLAPLFPGLFTGLTALTTLDLSNTNDLGRQFLPPGLFAGLTSLRTLDLSHTPDLDYAPLVPGLFTGLTALTTLNMSFSYDLGGRRSMPAGLFTGLTALKVLDLSNNPDLGRTPLLSGLFTGLTVLKTLDLSENRNLGGQPLSPGLFTGLTALTTLDLSNNRDLGRASLPPGLFTGLTALTTLDLFNNPDLGRVPLPPGLFTGLTMLTTLDLSENPNLGRAVPLPVRLFDEVLDTLTELSLDDELKSMASFAAGDVRIKQGEETIINVTLSRAVPVAMHIPISAETVGVSVAGGGVVIPAGMTSVPATIISLADAALTNSDALSLNMPVLLRTSESGEPGAPIARAGTDEQKARVLEEIVVLDNADAERALAVVGLDVCDRTDEVEAAILMAIRAVDGAGVRCESVTIGQLAAVNPDGGLVISNGSFQTLKIGDFAGLSSLTTLTVSNNQNLGEQALPAGMFIGLTALTTLNLSGNGSLGRDIALPADLFRGLTALKTLRMTDNPVLGESIDFVGLPVNLFRGLTALKTLDLSSNRGLSRYRLLLSGTFAGLTALETLDLSDNPFLRLNIELFLDLTALKTLNLSNNPYLGQFGEFSPEVGFLPERIFAGLGELTTLDLSNNAGLGQIYPLSPLLFNDLASLKTLDLSGNEATRMLRPLEGLDSADLPPAIFDGILDTLTELSLDPGLRGVVSFAAGSVRAGGEGSETSANVVLNQPVAVAMHVPIIVSGVDGVSVTGGGATIPAGVTDARAIVTAPANIIPITAGMLSLGAPVLLLTPESGEPTTPVTFAGTDEQKARILDTIVAVDGDNDERALIIIGICGRTDEVKDAIVAAINAVEGPGVACGDVTVAQLAGVDPDGGLVISGGSFQTLQISDFAGLSALTALDLSGNENLGPEGLPAGIFDDMLDTLTGLSLDVRLKATASFAAGSVSVRQGEEATINVEFRNDRDEFQFLPVAVHVPITVAGADGVSVAGGGVTIPAGTTNASTVITASSIVVPTVSGVLSLSTPVVVLLTPASGEPTTPITLAGTDEQKARVLGAIIAFDDSNDDLVFSVTGICNRTDEVEDAVLAAINAVEEPDIACADVTATQLAAVDPAGGLVISGESFQALQVDDFAGLTALTMLDLSDNRDLGLQAQPVDLLNLREALPAGLFADLTALADLDLSGNQNLDPEDLPSGVFDSVLDTLTGLSLDARLKGTVSFAAGSVSVGQGAATTVAVELKNGGMPHFLPATLYIPINITGADGVSVAGGGVLIPAATGNAGAAAQFPGLVPAARGSVTAIITALADAAATTAGMLSLGTPVLLLTPDIEESGVLFQGRGPILQVRGVAETPIARTGTDEQKARVLDAIVALDDANDERVLTVEERSSQTVVGICDRTEEVEVAILAAINAVEEPDVACDAVTAGQLAGVNPAGGLVISGGSFEILQVGDFTDLVALETLAIVNNPPTTNDLTQGLGSQILPAGLFAGLTALTTLDLSHNPYLGFRTLPAGLFVGLTELTTLDLSHTPFLGRPDSAPLFPGLFTGLTSLTTLDLSNTAGLGVQFLPPGLFAGLTSLRTLDLSHTPSLDSQPLVPGLFTGLTSLTTLNMSFSYDLGAFDSPPPGLFTGLTALKVLDLSNNSDLGRVPLLPGLFTGLTALTTLDLSHNPKLGAIFRMVPIPLPSGLFTGLTALKTLDLSENPDLGRAIPLPSGLFDEVLDTLTELSLDDELKSVASFAAGDVRIKQDDETAINVTLSRAVPVAMHIPISAETVGVSVAGGGVVIPAGMTSVPATIISLADAALTNSDALSLNMPVLLRTSESGEPGAPIARAGTDEQKARVLEEIVVLDNADAERALAVVGLNICDRTDEVEAAILMAIRAVDGAGVRCESITIGQLAAVNPGGGLVISNGSFQTLKIGDFAGLSSLTTLTVSNNQNLGEQVLPAGLFTGLTALTTLNLSGNGSLGRDIALPADLFTGLAALTTLNLSGNESLGRDTALPAGLFTGLAALTTLNLSGNDGLGRDIALPADLFTGFAKLTTLNLSGNDSLGRDIALPADLFIGLAALTTLNLSGNDSLGRDTALPADLFTGLAALTTLNLSGNDSLGRDIALPANLFIGLTELTTLNLSGNDSLGRDIALPADLFTGLAELTTLNLSGNDSLGRDIALPADLFTGLAELTTLNLSGNESLGRDIALSADLFTGLAALTTLDLSGNESPGLLQPLPAGLFTGLAVLTALDLSGNPHLGTADLPAGIFDDVLDTLTELSLDAELKGTASFSAGSVSVRQGGETAIAVVLDRPVAVAMHVPITVARADGVGVTSGVVIPAGAISVSATITVLADAVPTTSGMLSLSMPELLLTPASGEPTTPIVLAGTDEQKAGVLGEIVALHRDNAVSTLIVAGIGICDRTDEVQDVILAAINEVEEPDIASCDVVTVMHLNAVAGTLTFTGISGLQAGDFDGLGGLRALILSGNDNLTELPAGIFDDVLDTLTELSLDARLRGTASFAAGSVSVGQGGEAAIAVVLDRPVAVAMHVPITVAGADGVSVTGGGVVIPAGAISVPATVTALANTTPTTSGVLSLSTPVLLLTPASSEPTTPITLAGTDEQKAGVLGALVAVDGNEHTLIVTGICGRTDEVEGAIVAAVNATQGPGIACGDVTVAQLAGVDPDGGLVISGGSFQTLQVGDFAGLTALTTLAIVQNNLLGESETLPADLFAGLVALETLDLSGNPSLGLQALPADLFAGLVALETLDLSGNPSLDTEDLSAGIFDDVLDTLTELSLDARLRGTASFAAGSVSVGQGGEAAIAVVLDRPVAVAMHVPITVAGADGVSVTGGGVVIPAGAISVPATVTALADAALTSSGVLLLSTPVLLLTPASSEPTTPITLAGTDEQKAGVLGALVAVDGNEHTLIVTGICGRTDEVEGAIVAAVNATQGPGIACGDVTVAQLADVDPDGGLVISGGSFQTLQVGDFAGLTGLTTLELSGNPSLGLQALPAGLFAGLVSLTTLELSGNPSLNAEDLSAGIFDDVLDTLTELSLGAALRGTASFAAGSVSVRQGGEATIAVVLDRPVAVAMHVPVVVAGADGVSVTGGGVVIPAGATNVPTTVTVPADTLPTISGALSLSTPVLLLTPASGEPTTPIARVGTAEQRDRVLDAIVAVDRDHAESTLTVVGIGICDRTDEVRVVIVAAINAVEGTGITCDTATTGQLAAVNPDGGLFISNAGFQTLQVGDFAGLASLTTLTLSSNDFLSFEPLPAGLFTGLTALTALNLSNNRNLGIQPLPAGLFTGLTALTALDLSNNENLGIQILSTGLFTSLTALTTLDLSNNENLGLVHALPAGLFTGFTALTTLDLSNNENLGLVHALPADFFGGLTALTTLDLSNNENLGVRALPADFFGGLTALTTLDLSNNENLGVRALPADLFGGLTALMTLDLSNNENLGVRALPADLFGGLTALMTLDLSNNENLGLVHALSADFFDSLTALTTLDLSNNENLGVHALPVDLFGDLASLTTLDLSGSNLGTEDLPVGLFDGVLGTLTGLFLDAELRGTVSFAPGSINVRQGRETTVVVVLDRPVAVAMRVPITVTGTTGVSVIGGGVVIPAGATSMPATITALEDTAFTISGALSLNTPVLLLTSASGEPTTPIVLAGTGEQKARVLDAIVALSNDNNERTLAFTVTGICERTDEVRVAILAAINAVEGPGITCDAVTVAHLAAVNPDGGLVISNANFPTLQGSDFAGLSALTMLDLSGNQNLGVDALPAGLFGGLAALTTLDLSGNDALDPEDLPAGIFDDVLDTLTELSLDARLKGTMSFAAESVSVRQDRETTAVVVLDRPVAVAMRVPITVTGTTGVSVIGGGVVIPAGAISVSTTVTALADAVLTSSGVLSLSTPELLLTPASGEPTTPIVLAGTDEQKAGVLGEIVALHRDNAVSTLIVAGIGICDRTDEVQVAILAAINATEEPDIDSCDVVAVMHLDAVAGTLTLTGISSLRAGDFDGLGGLRTLILSGDGGLTELPAGIFDDVLDTLTDLRIDDHLKGRLSFSGPSEIAQRRTMGITVRLSPAFVAVDATVTVTFSGGNASDFNGLSSRSLSFDSSELFATIMVTAADNAAIGAAATFVFDGFVLRDGSGRPSLLPASRLIVPGDPDTHMLTIVPHALQLRVRVFLEGALQ